LSKNILFVWAGVHAKEKTENKAMFSEGYEALDNCYVQLHAETEHDNNPVIYQRE